MSNGIFNKTVNILNPKEIKILPMAKRQNGSSISLGDFVRKIREGRKLSLKDVERDSGNTVSSGYVSQLENGKVENLTVDKLMALAKGLGLGRTGTDELFAIARGVQPPENFSESWFQQLYEDYKNLLEQRHVAGVDRQMQQYLVTIHQCLEDLGLTIKGLPKKNADSPSDVEHIRKK